MKTKGSVKRDRRRFAPRQLVDEALQRGEIARGSGHPVHAVAKVAIGLTGGVTPREVADFAGYADAVTN